MTKFNILIFLIILMLPLTNIFADDLETGVVGTWTQSTEGALFMTFYQDGKYEDHYNKGIWKIENNDIVVNITESPSMKPGSTLIYSDAKLSDDVLTYSLDGVSYTWYRTENSLRYQKPGFQKEPGLKKDDYKKEDK